MQRLGSTDDLEVVTPTLPQDIKVDLNRTGSDKNAPLHVAVSVVNESAVNYLLLQKRVDPNLPNAVGLLPLEIACLMGMPRVVGIILKDKRTNLNYCHPQRGTCLHLAAKAD